MNYNEAIEYIHKTQKFGSELQLGKIKMLLEYMGDPHKNLRFIHVAGTNGKGSTVAFISSILAEAGYKVGVYTSPSILRFSERIRVNDDEILNEDIARITGIIKEKIDLMLAIGVASPTEFEIVTAVAFQYFYELNCDFVVLEVGLGGRLDATNVIGKPEVAVITTISFDHTDILGDTLPKIAFEKAGIIKKNSDVVLYQQESEIEGIFNEVCKEKGAYLHKVDFSTLKSKYYDITKQEFDFEGYKSLEITLLGEHQINNAAVAIKTAEVLYRKGYKITELDIRQGLAKTKWPGRFEVVNKSPLFLIDGAHNSQGVSTLVENLKLYFPNKRITFIVGVLGDKDYKTMMRMISPLANRFITVTPNSPRALSALDLALFLRPYSNEVYIGEETDNAIRMSGNLCSSDEIVCAFGSLYYIGEIREYFRLN